MDKDATKIAWKLFEKTGDIGAYRLYKAISDDKTED